MMSEMKTADQKLAFIRLRAEGKSYRVIEREIGVSRSTCGEWEKQLRAEIDRIRQDNLDELYDAYGMLREARVRRLGDTLLRIDEALANVDLSQMSPERLLDFKLKYAAALREEYSAFTPMNTTGSAEDTLQAIQSLYRRTASGETTIEQAKTELSIIDHMVDGYNRAYPLNDLELLVGEKGEKHEQR